MSMQDPIADMITRIRNAQAVGEKLIQLPASNIKLAILNVLKEEGYIENFEKSVVDGKSAIKVELKYYQGKAVIDKIKRISKVGLRIYRRSTNLPTVKAGMGIAVVSTPQGVMTERTARAKKLGGEVLITVE